VFFLGQVVSQQLWWVCRDMHYQSSCQLWHAYVMYFWSNI